MSKNKVKDTIHNLFSNGGKSNDKEKMGFGKKLGMKIAIVIGIVVAPIVLVTTLVSTIIGGGGAVGGVLMAKFGSDVVSILDGSWTFIGQRYQALSLCLEIIKFLLLKQTQRQDTDCTIGMQM